MRTRDRVTSACQRWWLWTTVTGDVVTQGQSSQGRRGAGVHGSTPYRRLATSAVSVALAKAAQAGFPRRGGRARASLGAALGAGRPTSKYLPDRDPCTVSKVWCPRPLRTSLLSCVVGVSVAALRNDARLQLLQLACDAGSWHAITRCWQLSWHPTLILFAPAGSWHATFLPVTPCYVCVAAMFQCLCACSWPVIFLCAVRGRFLNLT